MATRRAGEMIGAAALPLGRRGWPVAHLLGLLLAGCASPSNRGPYFPPLGHLGFPIGTYLRIEGVRQAKGKVGDQTLTVDHVNGKALENPTILWIENLRLPSEGRCILAGYETGRWIGVPPEVERIENLEVRQAPWQFQVYFIATSVQEPTSLAEQLRC